MQDTEEVRQGRQRWTILFMVFLMNTVFNFLIFQVGGLAGRIMPAFHIRPGQLAMILSIPFLANAVLGIPAGALADRFGARIVILIGTFVTVLCSFGRIGATSFEALVLWMFLLGIGPALLNANVAKVLGAWFSPEQMGTAMGLYIAGANAGITLALATSALFASVHGAFLASAVLVTVVALLWAFLSRYGKRNAKLTSSITGSLAVALKSRNVWIGAVAMFLFMGTFVTQNGFLANALVQAKGMTALTAGLVASSLSLAFIAGTLVGPRISARAGFMRPFLAPAAILAAAASYLAWAVQLGPLTVGFLIVAGLTLGTAVPLVMSLPMLLPEIGPAFAGSAGGILSMLQMGGAFLLPSYLILPLAGVRVDRVFLYVGLGYLAFALVSSLIPELGRKSGISVR